MTLESGTASIASRGLRMADDTGGDQSTACLRAADVRVRHMRQTLVWPLALNHPAFASDGGRSDIDGQWQTPDAIATEVATALSRVGTLWHYEADPLHHLGTAPSRSRPPAHGSVQSPTVGEVLTRAREAAGEAASAYGEYVYFHPYIQRFLYEHRGAPSADGSLSPAPFHLFRRHDIARVLVEIPIVGTGCARYFATVERLNLYIFNCGVALLAVEVVVEGVARTAAASGEHLPEWFDGASSLTLDDVLRFQNAFRRVYAPYWIRAQPQEVPSLVAFLDADGNRALDVSRFGSTRKDFTAGIALLMAHKPDARRAMPLFAHWHELLPLAIDGHSSDGKIPGATFTHIVDERMPSLVYVSLDNDRLEQVCRGDLVRLCFHDAPSSGPYPYDPAFLADFEQRHCYDRFRSMGTRVLLAGYSFVMVGSGAAFDSYIRDHYRRHYFQMALLSHLEKAALLTYSNWASQAVARFNAQRVGARLGGSALKTFERAIFLVQEQMLAFVHQYRFTGLSNQMQPQELQAYWRRHLGLDDLFEDVTTELTAATDYLTAREQARNADASTALAATAAIAAVIGLPLAFLGINFVDADSVFGWPVNGVTAWGIATAITTILGLSILGYLFAPAGAPERYGLANPFAHIAELSRPLRVVRRAFGVILVLSITAAMLGPLLVAVKQDTVQNVRVINPPMPLLSRPALFSPVPRQP